MDPKNNKLMPILVVLLIVASFLVGSLYTKVQFLEKGNVAGVNTGTNNAPTNPTAQAPAPAAPVDIKLDNDTPVLGDKNAKVAIVEYTDFQCPFCKQLHDVAYPEVKKEYIDTGKVKYYVRDFPLFQIHPYAQQSAEAANCAGEQGKFWEMRDKLFGNQEALQIEDLKKYAADLGLNTSQFNSCLDTHKYKDHISQEQTTGESYGVNGTPASFIGKVQGDTVVQATQISGAVPYTTFKAALDALLK